MSLVGVGQRIGNRFQAKAASVLVSLETRLDRILLAWLLLAGIVQIRSGLRDHDGARATRGLMLIAALVMLRFIDNEWSFTLRGIAFVLTGVSFVAAHLWLRRQVRA